MEPEQEVSYTVFFKDREANSVNQLSRKSPCGSCGKDGIINVRL